MPHKKPLTDEQLHLLGIKAVYTHLVNEGYTILNVRQEAGVDPQILATLHNERHFVVVRTARFPHMGALQPRTAARVLEHAQKHKAICQFASVGIANAEGDTDEEMAQPKVNGEYYINFKGLQPFPS